MKNFTVAIQYPSFGPQHPPRLSEIAKAKPDDNIRLIAMEMFDKDSDYEWQKIDTVDSGYERYTVLNCDSVTGRNNKIKLKEVVFDALNELQPDVLVVNGWGHIESRISLNWCRKNKCKIVILSDSVKENRVRFTILEYYKKWVVRGARAGFVAGTPQARYLNNLGVSRESIFYPGSCVVDNAYWIEKSKEIIADQDEIRKLYKLPKKYFICVARFVKLKNIPFLIRAYAQYRKMAGNEAHSLVICGSGREEKNIRKTINKYKLSDVILSGFKQVNELPVFYTLASCFILPSIRFECWGLVVNEAMACGLPVLVSSKVGCSEDLVHKGRNGYTFSPRDESQLASLMVRLTNDKAKLKEMGRESINIIAKHSPKVGAENLWKAVLAAGI